jgi:hypothetical protein
MLLETLIQIADVECKEDIRSITMEWNKALKRFINIEHSLLEIEKAVLEDLNGSVINELEIVNEVPDTFYGCVKNMKL